MTKMRRHWIRKSEESELIEVMGQRIGIENRLRDNGSESKESEKVESGVN